MGDTAKSARSRQSESKPERAGAIEAVEPLRDAAMALAKQARELVSSQLTRGTAKASGDMSRLAKALQLTSAQLQDNVASPYIEKMAARLERASHQVEELDPSEVAEQVEDFAKREPLWFIGGALAIGALGARFLKTAASLPPAADPSA
ncbi:MAG: hypothetical protein H5U40_08985 [Polyangiaceae bacterium]|nr:hypothetical protein [Polyangiaceae bacterium]